MKRKVLTKSLLVLLVSVLITSFSLNSYAQRGPRALCDSTRSSCRIPNLTADQKTKIETLKVKHLKEVTPLRNELDEKKAHLKTLKSMEKVDRDAINKTIDEITALHGKIMKMGVNHRLDVAALLTDEQKVFFNSHRGGRDRDGDRGRGMGRDGDRGRGRGPCKKCINN